MRLPQRLARAVLPQADGTLTLACLEEPAEVVRDRYGFVHLSAGGLPDLLRAQGYVHGQDRLFQMEMTRRLASGRLAELGGERLLELDRFVRRLRLRWAAEREAQTLGPEHAALVEAYCEGVNEFVATGPPPLELRLARLRPEPWSPVDVQLIGRLLSLSLCVNWEAELVRMRMVERLGAERARRLDPCVPYEAPVVVPPALARAAAGRGGWLRRLLGSGASNGWVVAGSRTESGKPLLANDLHLLLGIPILWHVQHLDWDGGLLAGFTIPGAPLVVVGRNEHVAWGMTAAFLDTQDLYVERLHPDDPHRYLAGGDWLEAEIVREEIAVRGRREPLVDEVVVTRHGPLVAGPEPGSGRALALRWSAHDPGTVVQSIVALAKARNLAEADRALALFTGPPQAVVLADVHGAIGFRAAGGPVPVRAGGDGSVPVAGWESGSEWRGFVPPDELPSLRDPERGFVVTANNRVTGDSYPHVLGHEYMNGYRARRIETLLESGERVSVDDCRRIQVDRLSLPGLELAAIARGLEAEEPLERRALELLAGWDGQLGPESAAGAVYGLLMRKLQEEAYCELGDDLLPFLGAGQSEVTAGFGLFERSRPQLLRMLADGDDAFFADGRTWAGVFRTALAAAVAELGPDPESWRWGDVHRFRLAHPFDDLPLLGRLLSRGPYAAGGDTDTVWQMAWPADRPFGPRCVGPSMRAVFDLSDLDGNHVVLPTGNSGHVTSRHYDDLAPLWREGELVPLATSRRRVDELAESRLRLLPAGAGEYGIPGARLENGSGARFSQQ